MIAAWRSQRSQRSARSSTCLERKHCYDTLLQDVSQHVQETQTKQGFDGNKSIELVGLRLGSLVYYRACRQINAERCSIFLSSRLVEGYG